MSSILQAKQVYSNHCQIQRITILTLDYFLIAPVTGSIHGIVWQDRNNNKVKDGAENTIPNITVSLYTLTGTLVTEQVSATDGSYKFDNIPLGDYYIKTQTITDLIFVKYSGTSVPFDSDITNAYGLGTTRLLIVFLMIL
ncbi:MAG: hypothetical protein IPO26_21255 [Saprospiraceae bacterium]|nr:hypothetical protein [Saprospiraceae bacterium]